ncbi:aminoglycoside adenylyltransferase domain-containing protein [Clostridium sp. YIM B02551]|uniref:aminoglycoside adenylyltransferase domain-containing protein n=1 Tax=Clostridium sp. YIM B02551 TaxID=2910679 RepID=UPI001EEC9AC8|nr:aminoglycoside adenylyltransferase domain-containing protein [Clostridium sp. YIM B02551]
MGYIPKKVKFIIDKHIEMIEERLPDLLEGYYIYGSLSLGKFHYGFSDIDFIAVVNREVSEEELEVLKYIHNSINKKYRKTTLDGMYVMEEDIESLNKEGDRCIRFNDGKFEGYIKFNRNSIDAYQLKKCGIVIKGKDIEDYKLEVNFDILINEMRNNLNSYWVNWMNGCKKFMSSKYIGSFVSLKNIEWGVLGVSRLYYTLNEKDITSKVGAGEYALSKVPAKWHNIIKESMKLRKDSKESYYKSFSKRRDDALEYMDYIIKESNRLLDGKK